MCLCLPDNGDYHIYYWYYGTLSLFQIGGERWDRWNHRLTATLLETQRKSGHAKGSWEPKTPFGVDGGRIFSTAIRRDVSGNLLSLLTPLRDHDSKAGGTLNVFVPTTLWLSRYSRLIGSRKHFGPKESTWDYCHQHPKREKGKNNG